MRTEDIFLQIDTLPGMEEFKSLCRRLQLEADNARGRLHGRLPLPNLIFAAAPGCGITLHIRLLTELLKSLRLLSFTGEEECFEWVLGEGDKSFDLFLRRVKSAGGFYGQFRGVIGLDVSELVNEESDFPALERLMEYVDARQGKIVFVFVVPDDTPPRILRRLTARFASISPVEVIHMPFPTEEAKSYLTLQLASRGYKIAPSAHALLEDAVRKLSATDRFEGYQTLLNLTEEIVWHKLSRPSANTIITADDLAFIFAADGYYSQFSSSHRRRIVGFGGDGED
ncbi:MAG: hypothetical protein IKK21_11780 [Clostridia bacterium]|nr:hypothetical protein [Clostridia bacterium]